MQVCESNGSKEQLKKKKKNKLSVRNYKVGTV